MRNPFTSTLFLVAALMAFSIASLLVVVLVASHSIERLIREEVGETRTAVSLVEDVYRLKVALERETVGLRGYLIGGDEAQLEPWRSGRKEFLQAAGDLEAALKGQDAQLLANLRNLEADHQAVAETMIELARRGQAAEMQALFRARGGPIMAAAAAAADRLVLAQQRRIGAIRVDVIGVEEQVRQQLFWAAFLSAPIMLLLALSIAWRVWVPLRDLAAASRAIAIGQAQVRVPRHYDDEFGAVATAFNTMAGEVERSLDRLQTMNAELVRVDRVKDDFLRTVTHELRTPLTAILGFARMIERDKLIHLDAKHRHAVERILGNSQRMVALVNDLLDSTAIRQGALDLVQDPAEYLPLMQETIAQLQPLAQQKRIALVLEACPIATPVVDATRIAQVLTNLVGNALKYTPEGGRVVVRASEENGWLVTEVQDPGPGIALEDQGRLFMPFTKLDDEHGGSGLGLSICKAIVEAHGGEIGVRSTPGEGATFWFTLPA